MSFEDKTLECFDCNNSFIFGVEEQEQFQSRGYTNEPKRCPDCRQARKANRETNSGSSYGNSSYGYTARRQLFPAVCAECSKETQVPFEPTQGRPVYCSDCYRKVRPSR
ncbi:MAG: CxxC-x17-CxxC domain-containing protein [Dehalococcoidales bacterium]